MENGGYRYILTNYDGFQHLKYVDNIDNKLDCKLVIDDLRQSGWLIGYTRTNSFEKVIMSNGDEESVSISCYDGLQEDYNFNLSSKMVSYLQFI